MIAKELIKQVKAHRGRIYLDVCNHNDCFWVQSVKADVLAILVEKFQPDEECGFSMDDGGFFGKDYSL